MLKINQGEKGKHANKLKFDLVHLITKVRWRNLIPYIVGSSPEERHKKRVYPTRHVAKRDMLAWNTIFINTKPMNGILVMNMKLITKYELGCSTQTITATCTLCVQDRSSRLQLIIDIILGMSIQEIHIQWVSLSNITRDRKKEYKSYRIHISSQLRKK